MNCLIWNARCLGDPRAFREFRRLLADTNPCLVFVSETKVTRFKSHRWREELGYDGFFMVDAKGKSGGLLLLWRASLEVNIYSYSTGHIDCGVETHGLKWRFTGFYGDPDATARQHSWKLLRRLAGLHEHAHLPWMVGGDFNEILSQEEKLGGNKRNFEQMEEFRRALAFSKLEEYHGCQKGFTWTNKRKGNAEILERLDRFVFSPAWHDNFLVSRIALMDEYGSDHRAVVLKMARRIDRQTKGGHKRFHFEQKWFLDDSFAKDFLMEWNELGGEILSKRLRKSQYFLTKWAGSRFDNIGKQIASLRKERVEILNFKGIRDVSADLERISDKMKDLSLKEDIHWRQRSRVNWLAHGDRNTQYFHNHATMRKKRNMIKSLKTEDGTLVTKDDEMAGVVINFYANLFTSSSPEEKDMMTLTGILKDRVPTHLENVFDEPFSEKEVKHALFQMHPTKAPGPDGFQPVFFQKLWGVIGGDVTRDCLKILNEDGGVGNWNNTYISLIPKVEDPQMVQHFRPISLCNTTYKIVSKVVVNKLRRWLPHIIDETQSAFVSGRLISDNILVGFECMHWIRNQKSSRKAFVAAKLDMSKAYDRVEWSFLKLMMEALGFGDKVVRLIMNCVSTVQYSFIFNGKVFGNLLPTRGLRQGDPLSPFLFVICSQGLSSILKQYMDQQLFAGIQIARRAPMISHLFFADDSLLFFEAGGSGPRRIKEALNLYARASGQLINYEKSALTFSPGAKREIVETVRRNFGVKVVQSHSIYLGLPTFMMRNRRLQFDYLAERASVRIGGWMNKCFSIGGKEVLIKSVIQAIPTYTMACFRIPVSTCNSIERVCARFWWGDTEKEKHLHWMTWKEMCKPKSKGGMGFRSLVDFNQALLAKQIWRLVRFPESLVSKLLKAKYFPDCDVMEAKVRSNCSFSWRSLVWGRDLLKKGLRWKIGDGRTVNVFGDAWLPNLPNGLMIQRPPEMENYRVAELMDENGIWDKRKLEEILLPIEVEEVLRVEKSSHLVSDLRFWIHDQNGVYSVKSGYLIATNYFDPPDTCSDDKNSRWWKFCWSFSLPQRVRIFAWRVFRNLIPSELNLLNHHVPVLGRCGWCKKGWDSTAHALIFCEKIRHNWIDFDFWGILKKWESFDILEIGGAMQNGTTRENFELWIMGMWLIWKARCAEKHKEQRCSWNNLKKECVIHLEAFSAAQQQAACATRIIPLEGSRSWKNPKRGRYRLDVDYAGDGRLGRGGVGAILRYDSGCAIFAMAKPIVKPLTTLHGELKALVHGIRMCVEEGISPVEVFTDSMLAVITIAEDNAESSILYEDFFDFFAMAKNLNVISVSHVRREANRAAHELARYARDLESTIVWHDCWSSWLLNIVVDDSK